MRSGTAGGSLEEEPVTLSAAAARATGNVAEPGYGELEDFRGCYFVKGMRSNCGVEMDGRRCCGVIEQVMSIVVVVEGN